MKKVIIGKRCTPSEIVRHDVATVTRIVVTYGGRNETWYASSIVDIDVDFISIVTVDKRIISLGKQYIVSKEEMMVVRVEADETAFRAANRAIYQNDTSENLPEKCLRVSYYWVLSNQEFEIVDRNEPIESDSHLIVFPEK